MMRDLFAFYGLDPQFFLDEAELKRRYYQKSRELHPDFHTMASPEEQMEKMQLSTVNNQAYKALSTMDGRILHILELEGVRDEEGKAQLPQEFLMEMLELNESMMEDGAGDAEATARKKAQLQAHFDGLWAEVEPVLRAWDGGERSAQSLETIKNYWLKKRYLRRIGQQLDGEVEL